jgi:hypothetical protein
MAIVVGYQCFFVKTFFNSNLEFQYEARFDLEQKSKVGLSRFEEGLYKLKRKCEICLGFIAVELQILIQTFSLRLRKCARGFRWP